MFCQVYRIRMGFHSWLVAGASSVRASSGVLYFLWSEVMNRVWLEICDRSWLCACSPVRGGRMSNAFAACGDLLGLGFRV